MYGLPESFDAAQFIEKTLDLICFTSYQAYLHFSEDYLITVEGSISINSTEPMTLPISLYELYPLIQQKIVTASITPPGTLSLTFEQGKVLNILDLSDRYESYSISVKGKTLVIV